LDVGYERIERRLLKTFCRLSLVFFNGTVVFVSIIFEHGKLKIDVMHVHFFQNWKRLVIIVNVLLLLPYHLYVLMLYFVYFIVKNSYLVEWNANMFWLCCFILCFWSCMKFCRLCAENYSFSVCLCTLVLMFVLHYTVCIR
jgi:hypothetical protein